MNATGARTIAQAASNMMTYCPQTIARRRGATSSAWTILRAILSAGTQTPSDAEVSQLAMFTATKDSKPGKSSATTTCRITIVARRIPVQVDGEVAAVAAQAMAMAGAIRAAPTGPGMPRVCPPSTAHSLLAAGTGPRALLNGSTGSTTKRATPKKTNAGLRERIVSWTHVSRVFTMSNVLKEGVGSTKKCVFQIAITYAPG